MKRGAFVRGGAWLVAAATAVVIATIAGLLLFALVRDYSRMRRVGQFSFFGCALNNYYSTHHSLPPASGRDGGGGPMHSWRVLLLPYFECLGLYRRYRFDEPWDGPNNRLLLREMPTVFRSPASRNRRGVIANYVAVVGPGTAWSAGSLGGSAVSRRDKILLIEFLDSDINWSEPRDLTVDEALRVIHGGTFYLGNDLFFHEVPARATADDIRKLLTLDDADAHVGRQPPPAGPHAGNGERRFNKIIPGTQY